MFMCRLSCRYKFSTHLGKHKGLQLLDLTVTMFCFLRNCQAVFHSGYYYKFLLLYIHTSIW